MDLEVVGRHALLFDDDAMAEFVNSSDALVEWNSLSIDRYDVRHLLSGPLPPRPRRRHHSPSANPDDPLESELDQERYVDLSLSSDSQDFENEAEGENAGSYRAVPFLYGNTSEDTDQKHADSESEFRPPFAVPEHLLHCLPPTEKVHQIIARTAAFVSKHGGQSEIVLRVKQGDNPTFGFLMPDHVLHPYYRFLVDHEEVLKSDFNGKSVEDENRVESAVNQLGGALSLLGSVYGSIEDEESTSKNDPELTRKVSEEVVNGDNIVVPHGSPAYLAVKDETGCKQPVPSLKGKSHVIKRNHSISTFKPGSISGVKKEGDALGAVSSMDKLQGSGSLGLSKVEPSILEPPSDLKRVIDKIVEFILRNGKEFEAVLVQQDTKHGRFPFLIPSNQYHPYYLKVLQKAQESKLAGRGLVSEKHDSLGQVADKRIVSNESNALLLSSDIPYDPDRKEKFRMIIGKSKKDGQDQPPKNTLPQVEVSVDAAAAAAILQAATKGIKNPSLSILSKTSGNNLSQAPSREEVNHSSLTQSSNQKLDSGRKCDSDPLASSNIKMAANAATSGADPTEAGLTREQKLRADRLKRAKMFAAMIQNQGDRLMNQSMRGSSIEPQESGFAESSAQVGNVVEKEREGSAVPLGDMSDKMENSENKESADSYIDRRPKRKYRLRSRGDEEEDEREGDVEQERDHKQSRKKKRSHHSHHSRDSHKHRKRHSSSKDKDSRRRHKHDSTSDESTQDTSGNEYRRRSNSSESEHGQSRHKRKHISSDDEEHSYSHYRRRHDRSSKYESRHSNHRCKPNISSDDEQRSSRHRQNSNVSSDEELRVSRHRKKYDSSSDDQCRRQSQLHFRDGGFTNDEHRHRKTSNKHRKRSGLEDLEEGEILAKSDHLKGSEGGERVSREVSVDLSKSHHDSRAGSQPSETTGVSDDLRAKIRAMLMATL